MIDHLLAENVAFSQLDRLCESRRTPDGVFMRSFPSHGLYAITDGPRPDLLDAVERALAGGARLLQYRDETGDQPRRLAEARALKQSCAAHGVPLLIDADIELAHAVDADGVHLADNRNIAAARARLGADAIVGVACCGSLDQARAAVAAGASYVSFGVFFPSRTKPLAAPVPMGLLRESATLGVPRVAIGGITPENGRLLIDAGADYLAVISAVFGDADPAAAARRIAHLFSSERALP
jgi:thiamine-phosphate pyrophosphorylase